MNTIDTVINVGTREPFQLLHMSDTHLCLADYRNNEQIAAISAKRSKSFPYGEHMLSYVNNLNAEERLTIVHTGDLIDFVSFANLDSVNAFTSQNDVFMTAGNHEFRQNDGEFFEDADYRNQSLDLIQQSFENNIRFSSRIINGVKLIALDNSYYRIDKLQFDFLVSELSQKMPTVLFMHTPIYTPSLYNYRMIDQGCHDAALMNVPPEKMASYSDFRKQQQMTDEFTIKACNVIMSCDDIKAVFTGHLHFDYEENLTVHKKQYITGCTTIRHITLN